MTDTAVTFLRNAALALCACGFLPSCAGTEPGSLFSSGEAEPEVAEPQTEGTVSLLRLASYEADGWQHVPLRGETSYGVKTVDGVQALAAEGRNSASGLFREVAFDPASCATIVWRWRVDELQESARLTSKESDDVAAAIFVLFGDPVSLLNPQPVPTLRYVWTNGHAAAGDVIANPYLPDIVRNVVVRAGTGHLGEWVEETRDLNADYMRAFGAAPSDTVHAVAIFTDNDQTQEPVTAYYGDIEVRCAGA